MSLAGVVALGSMPRLLQGAIDKLFGMDYAKLKEVHPQIYKMMSSDKNYEEAVQLNGIGQAERKGEGDAISADAYGQGYARRTVHNVWGKRIRITMEAFDDNLYMKHAEVCAKELAKALFHAKETNAAALFNNATSTSAPYVGADLVALLSASHPVPAGGLLNNLSTADISELALENAIIDIGGWVDNAGQLMLANVKKLVLPRQSRYVAHRILKSELRPGEISNDANALKDLNDIPAVVEWRYITDTDSWFLLTDQEGLVGYNRMAPQSKYHMDENTFDHFYAKIERYSFDHFDPRAVYGKL